MQMEEDNQNSNSTLIRQLIDAIEDNLANHLPSNAVFLAERLLAEQDTEETRSILAECYMAENKHYKVYDILKHCKSEMNRYKFALVCLKLNKNQDGERALLLDHTSQQDFISQSKHRSSMIADYVPNGSYGFYLLGLIFEGQQKFQEAKNYFVKALEMNPTLWIAYEKICKIGDQETLPCRVFCEKMYKQYINNKKSRSYYGFNPSVNFMRNIKESGSLFPQSEDSEDGGNVGTHGANKPRMAPTFSTMKDQGIQRTSAQQTTKTASNISQIAGTGAGRNDSNSRNSSAKRKKSGNNTMTSSQVSQPGVGSQQFPAASLANQFQQSGQIGAGSGNTGGTGIPYDPATATIIALQQKMSQSANSSSNSQQSQHLPGQNLNIGSNNPNQFMTPNNAQFQQLSNTVNSSYMDSRFGMQGQGNPLIPGGGQDFYQYKTPSSQHAQSYNIYSSQIGGGVNNKQNPQMNLIFGAQQNQQQIGGNIQSFFGTPALQQQQFGSNDYSNSSSSAPIRDIWTLLQKFGEPFYHMSLYLCQVAIGEFYSLPKNHQQTGWVLTHIGRCYMEIVKYSEAEKCYAEALRIEPYRLEGIEYYSSCLWHLKKQVELCHLAQQALEKSLFAPETWIAVGNCFSLQKEHENALKFFQRAIQLNQQSAYAHSLCGHEFVYNEDFNRARKSFQTALNLDLRNYNAWWGLGNIFYKQEKYNRATDHFQNAIKINQYNPVLYSFMGMTLAADRNYTQALQEFEKSERLDPKNGLNKFQKANTLVKLEKYDAALKELQELHLMMPKEAPIPMLMGKVYKKLKKTDLALKYFTDALDLENKDTQRIKALIESLHQENQDFGEDLEI